MEQILPVMKGILEILTKMQAYEVIVLDPKRSLPHVGEMAHHTEDMEQRIVEMFNLLVQRNNTYKACGGDLTDSQDFHPIIYVLQDYSELFEQLSVDGRDKLKTLLEKNEPEYQVYFIICEESGNMGIRTVEAWHKKHCAKGNGVFVGSGIADQYVLKVSGTDRELRKDIPDDFGFVVKNGAHCLCKLIQAKR